MADPVNEDLDFQGIARVRNLPDALSSGEATPLRQVLALVAIGDIDVDASSITSGTLDAARLPAFSGDVTTAVGATVTALANDAVTNAKLANAAANTVKANITGAAADPADVTLAALKTWLAIVRADIGNAGVANGVATLDGAGKIPAAQVPQIAIADTFVVASQAAMLALSGAEQGDVAIRTDEFKSYILVASPSSTLANWQELLSPVSPVQSVAGLTGTITAAALKTALAIARVDITNAGSANGVATLDSTSRLPVAQMPVPTTLV